MKISYVVTSYNKAPFLEDTLSSIAAERQSSGGEIVIVDDGSTDDSRAILARFTASNPDAKIVAQANRGVAAASNVGFRHSEHAAIRFCDADDILCTGSSRVLLEALASTGAGVAFGRHETYRSKPDSLAVDTAALLATLVEDPLRQALTRNLFSPSSTIMARRVAEQILPLPEHFCTSQDYMMAVRACFCAQIARIETVLSVGPETHGNRLSADLGRMYGETAAFLSEEIRGGSGSWRRGDTSYALKRNAGRALLWSRRNDPRPQETLKLLALKHFARWHDRETAARELAWIAKTVYRVEAGQAPIR
jgi:glycosyltransferase involved in cell wall biosynthesis